MDLASGMQILKEKCAAQIIHINHKEENAPLRTPNITLADLFS
jgi:hypothetical protein